MAIPFKRRGRKNLDKAFSSKRGIKGESNSISRVIKDESPASRYFNITEIPDYLGVGKNTIRLMGSVELKKNSEIQIEILDARGNPIYFEIPKKTQRDGSRLISIWVYTNRTDYFENTASGNATITIVGTDTNNIPVKWNRIIPVRVNQKTSSEIIFDEKTLPTAQVSASLQPFSTFQLDSSKTDSLSQGRDKKLTLRIDTHSVKYQKSTFGDDVILTKTGGTGFNSMMIGGEVRLDLSSQTVFPRETAGTQPTNFTSSILSVSSSNILQIKDAITGSNNHIYRFTDGATIPTFIEYFSSASQGQSENLQTVSTFTISNTQPITGEVHELRTSVKSKGLGTEFETISVNTFDNGADTFTYTIPIPSQHIGDPKTIKIEFLNSKSEPSETFILIEDVVFPGSTTFIGGKGSLITGSIFISNALGSGIEIGGASSGFLRSVGYDGFTSASLGKGPGGFLIYSGSGNLVVGVDQMEGVGFEFVGANDTSHLKFTTSGSGELDLKANKFFIGTPGSQFISGSGGKIEISSSDFHLDPISNQLVIGTGATIKSSLTVNQIRTPAIVNGSPSTKANASSSIDSDGFARFASASIAGFEIVSDEIRSSDNALRLKAAGDITASRVLLSGGTITDGVTILGAVTANNIRTPATIGGSPSTVHNASSSIDAGGFAIFKSASIGGWDITTASIEGGNLIMRPQGILQTKDYASGFKGWKISSEGNGTAEFENVRIRGTLRTTTFEKESVNAVGGQLWVTNATTLTGSNITANDTTMSVKNASGFTAGEILLSKKVDGTGFQTEYILVNSASIDGDNTNSDEVHGRLYVTRGYGSGSQGNFVGDLASTSQSYDEGQVLVSTGLSGSGYIKMNANPRDTATPFMDIVERTGSGLFDVALRARLGDLSGLAGNSKVFGSTNPGFGLATDNVFLQGGIIAKTGSIGGIELEAGKLYIGVGTHGNSNTGFYVDSGSKFSLGDKLTWDGTSLTVRGQLRLESGTTVQQALNDATSSNTAKSLAITVDSQVYAFDNAADTSATPNVINFIISQQNLSATVATSDITIKKQDGSSISTPSLGGTSNISNGSGQQSGSISFSGLSLAKTDLPITIEVSKDDITDSTTIFKVQGGTDGSAGSPGSDGSDGADGTPGSDGTDGTDAVTAFLTNESHTFPANTSGVVSDFSTGVTDIVVFEGITNKTSNYSFSGTGSAGVSFNQSTDTFTITAMGHDSGSLTITAVSSSTQLVKTMSLAKSTAGSDGLDGSSAKLVNIISDSQTFSFDDSTDTSATPSTINLTVNQQNLSGTIATGDITMSKSGGGSIVTPSLGGSVSSGTGTRTFTLTFDNGASPAAGKVVSKSDLPVTISVSKDSLSDSIKIFKIEGGADGNDGAAGTDGADAVTGFLTNESHTIPANSAGSIATGGLNGAITDMIIFEGITDSTNNYKYNPTGSTGVSFSHLQSAGGSSGNINTVGHNHFAITALTQDSGSLIINATSGSGAQRVLISKTMSFSKSKQGDTGPQGPQGAQGNQGPQGEKGAVGSPGAAGAKGATGADNQDFSFLGDALGNIDTSSPGGLPAGLLMTSEVLGFHNDIAVGDGTNATINDFTSFLDSSGNFYLGSGSAPLGAGYFAWNNTSKTLLISGSGVDFAVQEFFFGRGNTSISGSNGNIKITGDVELVGRNTPNPLFFDDFSQAAGGDGYQLSYINQGNNPKIDGSGVGFYNNGGLTPDRDITTTNHGQFFGPVVEVGNNSGNDQLWLSSNTVIPFNSNALYEVEVRVKRTAGSGNKLYAGVTAFSSSLAANGSTTLTAINNAGTLNQFSSQHYFAASNQEPTLNQWTIYKGYFKGTDSEAGGQHSNITDPGALVPGANSFAPMILVNFNSQAGTYYIDYIKVSEFQGGGGSTTISGDAIKAGTIRSNNLSSTEGTLLDLSNGTFKMGGTTSPKLEFDGTTLSVDGTVSASAGNIGGFHIGTNHIGINSNATADNAYGDFTLGKTGYISADQFKISAAGVATFKGVLEDTTTFKSGSTEKEFNTIFGADSTGIFLNVPRFKETAGSLVKTFGTRFSNLESAVDSELSSIGGSLSGYSCVLPGTKIICKRGEINIEDTKDDDIIKVFNFETKEWDWSPIDEITTNKVQGWSLIKTESGKELKCSNSHLLYHPDYPNSAIAIDELGVGGELYVYEDEKLIIDKIKSIQTFDEEVEVWNYELDIVHNYVSNGILSHNTSSKLSLSPAATLSHQYVKDIDTWLQIGDLVKLDSNNELQKVTNAKDSSVVGILWEKLELEYPSFGLETIGDEPIGSKSNPPPENFVSSSFQDSLGNFIPSNQTDSKEIWKVASVGDSVDWDTSGSFFTLSGFKMCNQGGDVVPGDLLCSSDTPGYLMKQPSEWVITSFSGSNPVYEERQSHSSYTVAKCMVSASWDSNGRMENVYGYLYCG